MSVRRRRFTFRRFSRELWVKAERVIRFTCCGLKRGLEFSPVQFLQEKEKSRCARADKRKHIHVRYSTACSECVNICETEAKTPSRLTPFPSLCSPVQPRASCWLLNTHAGLLEHTQQELALCPDTHKHSWHGQDWWPVVTKPTIC